MRHAVSIKQKDGQMGLDAVLKLNAKIALQDKDAGLKKMPIFMEFMNMEKFQEKQI